MNFTFEFAFSASHFYFIQPNFESFFSHHSLFRLLVRRYTVILVLNLDLSKSYLIRDMMCLIYKYVLARLLTPSDPWESPAVTRLFLCVSKISCWQILEVDGFVGWLEIRWTFFFEPRVDQKWSKAGLLKRLIQNMWFLGFWIKNQVYISFTVHGIYSAWTWEENHANQTSTWSSGRHQ